MDKRVKLAPLSVTFPLKDLSGTNLDIEYRDGVDKEEAFIKNGLNGFIELVQRWIRMHGDIRYMGADTKMLMKCAGSTDEVGVCQTKMRAVAKYEELQPAIDAVFSGSGR